MSTEQLKTLLIEKIIYSQDEVALQHAFSALMGHEQSSIPLTPEQTAAIEAGLADMKAGRVISQEELEREDAEWL